ncbi:MAG: hypothetical protein RSE04_05890 [Hydrogenoanaerobacterium sp.]
MNEKTKAMENATTETENTTLETQANDLSTKPTEEHVAENAIATATTTAIAEKKTPTAYITGILNGIMDAFIAANDGLDMDFVYMGSWLVMDKKGNFIEKDDETVKYGDHIDVVVGQGEKRWSLWGAQNSPEDGQLIVACKEKSEAEAMLNDWLQANPEATSRYSVADLELRYMAFVVPVDTVNGDDMPKIYLMSFSPTATISWGKYAMKVFQGGYKLVGIKAGTGVTTVVTRISTSEKKGKDPSISWLGIDFEAMGLFNPEDYKK